MASQSFIHGIVDALIQSTLCHQSHAMASEVYHRSMGQSTGFAPVILPAKGISFRETLCVRSLLT